MIKAYFKKRTRIIIVCTLFGLATGIVSFIKPNETKITNGILQATLYLPDGETGYYRGQRFDWSGIISDLEYNGHSYYGQWYKVYSPTKDDAVMGPVEAFDPLGYADAKPGESFVKIGVGALIKPDSLAYSFSRPYKIVNAGKWKVKTKPDEVQFTHTLNDSSYSYKYKKSVKLIKDKPLMVISHTLKNTGNQTIETAVFDHNFFVIDKQPTGPGFTVTFPFKLTETLSNGKEDYVRLQDNQLIFIKELNQKSISFKDLTNGNGSANYDIKIENHTTGAGVGITADRPISKLVFWSAPATLCPEPYINIKVSPGQEFSWKITYEYYNCSTTKQIQN